MVLSSCAIMLLVWASCLASTMAGTWSHAPWTEDSSTGLSPSLTIAAYRFGSATTATVNGVTVPGSPFSLTSANVDVTLTSSYQGAVNNLTALGGTGSALLAQDFVYNGVNGPLAATVKNLTIGQGYVVSFFGVGFDADAERNVNFTSGSDSQVVNQNHYGSGNGIRVDYQFTATATTQSFTLMETVPLYSWGLNAIALSVSARAPTVAVNAASVITNITGPHDNATNLSGEKTASGFQMNANTVLGKVRWKGDMNVAELWSDDGTGNPGALLLPLVTLSPGVAEASEPILLAAGVKYWIVWDNTSSGGNDIPLSSQVPAGTGAVFLGNRRYFGSWSEWPVLNFMVEVQEARTAGFTDTASLSPGRDAHTATLLQDGRVLVAGGVGSDTSCALYDPATQTWTPTGSLAGGRQNHTATLLPDGRVLVTGGYHEEVSVASAEIYNPATGEWASAGSMATGRFDHGAALLPDGRVLVVAGREYDHLQNVDNTLLSAEIYDPQSNTWSAAASLTRGRFEFTTTALPGGKVLAVGGYGVTGFLTQAEVYDPATGVWSSAGSLNAGRYEHTATALWNGKVLVAGGYGGSLRNDAELYDPDSNSWMHAGSFNTARDRHAAALLPDGRVIIAGGNTATGAIASAQIYDPAAHAWTDAGSLSMGRREHTATELADGDVLFVGGYGQPGQITSAELYSAGVEVITVAEGSEGSISGTFHDSNGNATVTVSASTGSIYKNNASGTWHWSKTGVNGPARERVTVTATDELGAVADASFVFSVTNVAPVFELGANTFVPALTGILNRTVAFTDPGADTWSGTVDYGDGSGAQALLVDQAARTFALDHTYDFDGIYTVSVTLEDGDGGVHTDSYQVTRDSRPPSIGIGSFVVTVPQGSTSVTIPLVRMIGSQALSFQLSTLDGTASAVPPFAAGLAGKDYQALTTTVDFAEGEMLKEVEITLIPRAGANVPNTRFQVVLTGAGWEDVPANPKTGHPVNATVQVLANDTTAPTLTVKTPATGATLNHAPPVIITGIAGDKNGIDRVEIEHDGELIEAVLGSATRSTSIPFSGEILPAADGPVTFTVTAYDLNGNSTVVTRAFNYVRWYDVVVSRDMPGGLATPEAAGMVTLASTKGSFSTLKPARGEPTQQGSVLPGAPVTLTAKPAAGHVFSHWEGLPVDAVTSGTVASFTMPAEDVTEILAVFVANPFAALGTTAVFHGLLASPEADRSNATLGSLSATLTTKTGALSGKLLLGGVTTSFAGTVHGNGDVWLKNAEGPMTGSLEIPGLGTLVLFFASDSLHISLIGAVTDSFGTAPAAIHSAANPVPAALLNDAKQGFYTVALPALEQTPPKPASTYPQGAGYGSLTLKKNGTLTLAGVLADGSKFTAASALVAGNTSPVHAQLPTPGSTTLKGGSLLGRLAFDPDAPDTDVSSASLGWAVFGGKGGPPPESGSGLLWLRPEVVQQTGTTAAALATQLYTQGWEQGITVGFAGALYDKTRTVQSALELPGTGPEGNAELAFEGAPLLDKVAYTSLNVEGNKVVKLPVTDRRYTLSFTGNTGVMKGTFTPFWSNPGTSLPAFNGVILQKGANRGGRGFFLSNRVSDLDPESGVVTLGPP